MNIEATFHISKDELKELAQGKDVNEEQIEHIAQCDSCYEYYILILTLQNLLLNDN